MTRPLPRILRLSLVLLLTSVPHAQAEDSSPMSEVRSADFAQGILLTPAKSRAIHSALLPSSVYRGLAQPDFGDLRVYNQAGAQVPHAVRPLPLAHERVTKREQLPIFPLHTPLSGVATLGASTVHVEIDSNGAILDIRQPGASTPGTSTPAAAATAPPAAAPAAKLTGYLVDASHWHDPIDALQLTLEPAPGDYTLRVAVEASDDLTNFHAVGDPQTILRLKYQGQEIERSKILLPQVRARYLRLTWGDANARPLHALYVESGSDVTQGPAHPERLQGTWENPGKIAVYDLGGPLPVDSLRLVLAEDNTLLRGAVTSAAAVAGPFTTLHDGAFYRVRHEGTLLESPRVSVPRTGHRYLRLRVALHGGGAESKPPILEISRHPDQLLFAERGRGPFQLVFGHHGAPASAFAPGDLVAMLPDAAQAELPASDSALGPVRTLAGPSARKAPPPPPPIKKYVLWGVLILAVLLLARAAFKLLRESET